MDNFPSTGILMGQSLYWWIIMTLHRDVTGMMVNVIPKWPQVPAIFRLENYHYLATLYMYIYIYTFTACIYHIHTIGNMQWLISRMYIIHIYIYIHTYIHTPTYIHIHTYIHGHVHTYIYIPTYTHAFQAQERPCHRGVNMGGRPKLARVWSCSVDPPLTVTLNLF